MGRSILDCLEKMKRKDLADLGFRLALPPPGRRGELPEWRRMAAETIPELDGTLRECLGYKGLVRLRKCLTEAPLEDGELLVTRATALQHRAQLELGLLRRLALAWQDRQGWHVQPCVPDMLTLAYGERSLLEASDDLYQCSRGFLLHYGMLPVEQLQKLILGHEDKQAEGVVLAVYAKRCGLSGVVFMERESIWLCLPELPDPAALAAEVLRPDRRLIDYAPCTEEEARRAAREGVTGSAELLARLMAAARLSGATRSDLLSDMAMAERIYQEDDRDLAMDTILTHLDDRRFAVGELLADRYLNTVPVWRVKGHTVQETRSDKPAVSVPWNAPCPCGSGRRWGQCCGRGN